MSSSLEAQKKIAVAATKSYSNDGGWVLNCYGWDMQKRQGGGQTYLLCIPGIWVLVLVLAASLEGSW